MINMGTSVGLSMVVLALIRDIITYTVLQLVL